MPDNKLACLHSGSEKAIATYNKLSGEHEFVAPEAADIIVPLGGDGFLLRTLHEYLHLKKPFYGINCGTLGFLMNDNRSDSLEKRLQLTKEVILTPLRMEAQMEDGSLEQGLAFNEVSLTRHSGQSANIRITINGEERLAKYSGDGIIVATSAGSTAYNLSAHGPIIPLASNLLALTPVSPFRPRRWKGALLPNTSVVTLENLDPGKRPLAASADFKEMFGVHKITIGENVENSVVVLYDPEYSLEEKMIAEQFAI